MQSLISNLVSPLVTNLLISDEGGLPASTLFDLESSLADSYTSGQTWANLATPADGSAKTAYDFWLGNDGSAGAGDPTFVGTAGDPLSFFSLDGGDQFDIKANTTFINNIHKTDQTDLELTFGINFYWPPEITTGSYFLIGNANATSDHGFRIVYDRGNENWEFRQANGSAYATTDIGSSVVLEAGWHTFFFTLRKTSGTAGTYYLQLDDETALTGSITAYGATTTDATDPLQISGASGSGLLPADSQISSVYLAQSALGLSEIAAVKSIWETRHDAPAALIEAGGNSIWGGETAATSDVVVADAFIWNNGTSSFDNLQVLTAGTGSTNQSLTLGDIGQNITFMQKMVARYRRAYLVQYWQSGLSSTPNSSLEEGWNRYRTDDADSGEYITTLQTYYTNAIAAMPVPYFNAGIVFCSPIIDARDATAAAASGTNFMQFANAMRDHIGDQTVPVICCQAFANGVAGYGSVAAVNARLAEASAFGTYLDDYDISTAASVTYQAADIHPDEAGYKAAGVISFNTLEAVVEGSGVYSRTFTDLSSVTDCALLIDPTVTADLTLDGSNLLSAITNHGAGGNGSSAGALRPLYSATAFGSGLPGLVGFHDATDSQITFADDPAYDYAAGVIDIIFQFRFNSQPGGTRQFMVDKWEAATGREFTAHHSTAGANEVFVSNNGTSGGQSTGTGSLPFTTGVNYVGHFRCNGTTSTFTIRNQASTQASTATVPFNGTAPLYLMAIAGGGGLRGAFGKCFMTTDTQLNETQARTIAMDMAIELGADYYLG